MMYLLTPEEHAQILSVMKMARGGLTSCRDNGDYIPPANPYFFSELDAALAMLKAMKPVEPVAIVAKDGFAQIQVGWRKVVSHNTELYAQAEGGV